jgi:hypothetical protein
MSTKIVRVDQGDYKLIVGTATASGGNRSAGSIVLDTNLAPFNQANLIPGTVVINGNLLVTGETTTVETETLTVQDPIIVVNQGEPNAGVEINGVIAGIEIDRGLRPNAYAVWDENIFSTRPGSQISGDNGNVTGSFIFKDANGNLRAVVTDSINTQGRGLSIDVTDGTNKGVISVQGDDGDPQYEKRILRYTGNSVDSTVWNIVSVSRNSGVATVTVDTDLSSSGLEENDRVNIICTTDDEFSGNFVEVESVSSFSFTYDISIFTSYINLSANGTVRPDIIINDNYIPNIRAVAEYTRVAVSGITTDKIVQNDTKIQVYDSDSNPITNSLVTVEIDGTNILQIDGTNGVLINQQLILREDTIGHIGAAAIGYTGTYTHPAGQLHIDTALNIKNWTQTTPSVTYPGGTAPNGYVRIYSTDTPGTGGTGLYFVNATGTNDELISKTKALLYSLIL